jgi:hypothetical protein
MQFSQYVHTYVDYFAFNSDVSPMKTGFLTIFATSVFFRDPTYLLGSVNLKLITRFRCNFVRTLPDGGKFEFSSIFRIRNSTFFSISGLVVFSTFSPFPGKLRPLASGNFFLWPHRRPKTCLRSLQTPTGSVRNWIYAIFFRLIRT